MLSQVSPFRNLRIKGYLLLPVAYRSLSRLSSALSAKASTLRSSLLNLHCSSSVTTMGRSFSRLYLQTFAYLSICPRMSCIFLRRKIFDVIRYSVFKEQKSNEVALARFRCRETSRCGETHKGSQPVRVLLSQNRRTELCSVRGLKWTRTTDLTLIRRAL